MNSLGYTNKELAEMLGDKSLKSNTVYFFNYMRDYPSTPYRGSTYPACAIRR